MYFFRNYNKSLESFHMHDTKTIVLFFVFKSVSDDIFIRMILKFYPRGVNKYANASIKHVQIPLRYKTSPLKVPKENYLLLFVHSRGTSLPLQNGWIVTFIQLLALLFFSSLPSKNTHHEHFHFPSCRSIP